MGFMATAKIFCQSMYASAHTDEPIYCAHVQCIIERCREELRVAGDQLHGVFERRSDLAFAAPLDVVGRVVLFTSPTQRLIGEVDEAFESGGRAPQRDRRISS
jgi:hypothetical protein